MNSLIAIFVHKEPAQQYWKTVVGAPPPRSHDEPCPWELISIWSVAVANAQSTIRSRSVNDETRMEVQGGGTTTIQNEQYPEYHPVKFESWYDTQDTTASSQPSQHYGMGSNYSGWYNYYNYYTNPWAASGACPTAAYVVPSQQAFYKAHDVVVCNLSEAGNQPSSTTTTNFGPSSLFVSHSDLSQVTLKKPRVTFSSNQVLQLEQEFKVQR